jgi:hypothetical protein
MSLPPEGQYTQKFFTSRISTDASEFIGESGRMFYDEADGQLRLSNGITPGGILVNAGGGGIIASNVILEPEIAGPFTVEHNLGQTPISAVIQMTSSGSIWFQIPNYDATNLYLVASDDDITGNAVCFVF